MKNKYKICIHIARSNSFIGVINNVPFAGAPAGAFDEVKFTKQKITITAIRSKKFRTEDILKKKGNSLYGQILKSIVFLYLKNGERIRITKITVDRSTTRTQDKTFEHDVDKYMQPLADDFTLRFAIPDSIIDLVWREGKDYANLRSILTHFLSGLSSLDRYYIFERLWRAFEQLCLFHNRADRDNCDFKALAAMRTYIAGHLGDFPEALNEANKVSALAFRKFDWEGYVKNEFPVLVDGASRKMFPQSTLNKYIHQIMDYLRTRLEALMLEVIRSCNFVQNDETRILVRSRKSKEDNFKYNTEHIHPALSLEKKLVVMLYKEGSRSHEIPEEKIFRGSLIECFTADRAPLYVALEKDLEKYYLQRQACWQHARHYLVDAFVSDHRVLVLIQLINALFLIEREFKARGHSAEQRYRFRLEYSASIVGKIMSLLKKIRAEKDKYGVLVMRAVNYILDY